MGLTERKWESARKLAHEKQKTKKTAREDKARNYKCQRKREMNTGKKTRKYCINGKGKKKSGK